jgi:ATP-binding cassette subfamily F protein 3
VIWLEDWLRSYDGTLLLISHDRDFLDRVCSHIGHIEQAGMTIHTGNYSAFEVRRAEQLASQQAAHEKQQREIKHMQQFVDRFRAKATKARQAQSRLKALERMKVISQAHVDSPFHFHFRRPDNLPHQLIQLERASVGYGGLSILHGIELKVREGDRIGLLGHNGAGKSTLIKLLAGEIRLESGKRKEAKDINIGYFAQHQLEQLDSEASPLLHLQRLDKKAQEKDLRNYLGGFAFFGDMATEPVAPLSGGEKARLVLAMIVYQKPNLLLLDEPTNHLDLEMRHALTTALQEFEGAMIIVSHDRHLLRTVSDTLLLVADGKVSPFDGDLDDYRQWVKEQVQKSEVADKSDEKTPGAAAINKKQLRQDAAERRRQLQPQRNKVKKLEQQMEKLGEEKARLEEQLADNSLYSDENKDKLRQLLEQQATVTQQLQDVEEQWLEAGEALEALQD